MKEKLRRFMIGRYGNDSLNQFISVCSIACLFIALVSGVRLFYWLGVALLIYMYFRLLSRNISARTAENYKFYTIRGNITSWAKGLHAKWGSRRVYRYYTCPQCHQKLRVPRGRGRLQISCPRCGTQFIKKT